MIKCQIDYITLKHLVLIMTSAVKDDGKFYPQLFQDKALYGE